MKKVLITGVTGFTGRYLAPKLAEAGYEVHGTAHADGGGTIDGLEQLHELDISNAANVSRLVSSISPNKVVHLAGISFVAHSDAAEMYRINILGARNLLDALASAETRPTAILLASSANVYGNARAGMVDENVPLAPANDYGITKAAAELLIHLYGSKLPIIITRPFNYTGCGQSEQFLIPKIVAHVRKGENRIELGNLDIARDFSDVRGVVDAYLRLVDAPAAIGETFNICSGRAISLHEIVDLITKISGHQFSVYVNPAFVRPYEVKTLWGSPKKLEHVIGPLNMPPLEETLRWMLEA